jgi:hypothetical protein
MNLVDLVTNQLGGDMIGRIGNLLGIGNDDARSAVDAGVPAMLAGISGLAGTSDGARKLTSALDSLDDRLVGNIGSALSGGGADSVIKTGSNALSSLLGGNMLSGLGTALSRFTGLGTGAINSLLGLLAPIVLGTLKSQKSRMGLDASGLANLLAGQRQNVVNAMPSGLGSMLAGVPGISALSGLGESARDVAGSVYGTGRSVANTAAATTRVAANTGSSALRWLIPVAAVLGLVALIWYMVNRTGPNTVTAQPGAPRNQSTTGAGVVASVDEQVTRLTSQVSDFFTGATDSLKKITDRASAEAALPQLRDLAGKFDSMRATAGNLPSSARERVVSLVAQSWPALQAALDKAMAIPGVSDVLRPVVDQIRNGVNAFTQP